MALGIFTPDELKELDNALQSQRERGEETPFGNRMQAWERFVRDVERVEGYRHLSYEFFNDVSRRETLFRCFQTLRLGLRQKVEAALRPLDDRFLQATQRTVSAPFWGDSDPSHWWNFSLPKKLAPDEKEEWDDFFQAKNYIFKEIK